ncbi:colicin E3/pyocin S6 family cytotoxin [Pseudomonas sp. H3(2019)]|uniref:colicin E3/pyocin S6 family cytotoxin n=1 Tax=Pseudomonas sp. H3(2019) TaxID=2598724 RepID=UPI001190C759|nr:colicin E3/pyocin S6 family cytotoxin [Pseudomonas sp. H3(2019)]TVT80592.1 toxin [Pseudomonas sp. H3(2019)]
MAGNKDIPRVPNPPSGDGHHITHRYMTATELAERDARQKSYDDMLARQTAFEKHRQLAIKPTAPIRAGCVFAKSCKLPDAIIDYSNTSGMVPTDSLKEYGEIAWLGARDVDEAGLLNLETISGTTLSLGIGRLALRAPTVATPAISISAALGVAGATVLAGVVALFWTPSLGDSALYTEDQLRSLKQARTRVRLQVEQQADGSLKGYGFYTGKNRDWEMVDVVQFKLHGSQQVADLGGGIELIWTPVVDPSGILGIPALEAAPQAPHIWVYPPTPAADSIIVNPIYPPEYKDFILVFPADSGVKPVYIVVSVSDHKYHPTPQGALPAFPDAIRRRPKTSVQGGGGLRPRWTDKAGNIYEWDRQHGTLEKYNKRGKHLGEFDVNTGEQTKKADKKREVEP